MSLFRPFFSPPNPGPGYGQLGPDQIVIVYVSRACTKKNLESNSPINLVLGHIFLIFGHFDALQALFEPP